MSSLHNRNDRHHKDSHGSNHHSCHHGDMGYRERHDSSNILRDNRDGTDSHNHDYHSDHNHEPHGDDVCGDGVYGDVRACKASILSNNMIISEFLENKMRSYMVV